MFIQNCASRDNSAFGVAVVEFPAPVVRWIPNEDTLLHVGANCTTLVLPGVYVGQTAANANVGDLRLPLESGLKWSGVGRSGRPSSFTKDHPHRFVQHGGTDVGQPLQKFCDQITGRSGFGPNITLL